MDTLLDRSLDGLLDGEASSPSSIIEQFSSNIASAYGTLDIGFEGDIIEGERSGDAATSSFTLEEMSGFEAWCEAGPDGASANGRIRQLHDHKGGSSLLQTTFGSMGQLLQSGVMVTDAGVPGAHPYQLSSTTYPFSSSMNTVGDYWLAVCTFSANNCAIWGRASANTPRVEVRETALRILDSGSGDKVWTHTEASGATLLTAFRRETSTTVRAWVNGDDRGTGSLPGSIFCRDLFQRNGIFATGKQHLLVHGNATEEELLALMSAINDLHSIY